MLGAASGPWLPYNLAGAAFISGNRKPGHADAWPGTPGKNCSGAESSAAFTSRSASVALAVVGIAPGHVPAGLRRANLCLGKAVRKKDDRS